MLACAITGFRPCCSNSCWQKARAKNPRESSRRSMSMMNAPFNFVSVKIIWITSLSFCPIWQAFFGPLRSEHARRRGRGPAQSRVQLLVAQQPANVINPRVARTLEIFQRKVDRAVGIVKFTNSLARVPLRLECRNQPADLAAIHPVAALVGPGSRSKLNLAVGHNFLHHVREFVNAVVL